MKIKRLGVSFELLKITLAQGNIVRSCVVKEGLPEDAVPCGVSMHDGVLWLDLKSESFPEVEEGQPIPDIQVLFETLQPQE